jgi:DNA-binding CsgD family transcriptional regulator
MIRKFPFVVRAVTVKKSQISNPYGKRVSLWDSHGLTFVRVDLALRPFSVKLSFNGAACCLYRLGAFRACRWGRADMLRDRYPVSLTPREAEVLQLVATGLSAKEVANRISISPRTVERHIEHVRMKLRARNRPHMVTEAIARGILIFDNELVVA